MLQIFSREYFVALASSAVAGVILVASPRLRPGNWTTWLARALAVLLVVNQIAYYVAVRGSLTISGSLPLGLCEAATFVSAAALWWRVALLIELTYFWGVGGSIQALLTPMVSAKFPSFYIIQYYIDHSGIVIAALLLVVGLKELPRVGAARRTIAITAAYAAVVFGIDKLTGGDYLYLMSRPSTFSLLSLMGPWPWYVLGVFVVGIIIIVVLDQPLRLARSRASIQPASVAAATPAGNSFLHPTWARWPRWPR